LQHAPSSQWSFRATTSRTHHRGHANSQFGSHRALIAYLRQISLVARYFGKSPDLLGREDIRAYQLYLTEKKKLSPASITMAIGALRFSYKVTLRRERVTAVLEGNWY
jgi:hypothetical protein